MLLALTLLHWVSRPEGLSRHFRWPDTVCAALRHELRWFAPLFVTASGLVVLADEANVDDVTLAIGRPTVILAWSGVCAARLAIAGPEKRVQRLYAWAQAPPPRAGGATSGIPCSRAFQS